MVIHKLKASFGRLQGDTLELENGLNIIEAPNESGKSTWSHFIRAMLYGVSTSERSRAGSVPDRKKFQPWGSMPMEGEMELTYKDRGITLRRSATGGDRPMGPCTAYYTGTGERIPELAGKSVGEQLTGVTEPVFRRSVFITRPEMSVDRDSDLEKRISRIVTSGGEEDASYTEVEERLRRWQRKRRWRSGSGRIAEAEGELTDVRKRLSRIEEESSHLADMRAELADAEQMREQLEAELKRHRRDEFLNAVKAAKEAQETARESRRLADELEAEAGGLSRDDIADVREAAARTDAARVQRTGLSADAEQARAELEALEEKNRVPVKIKKTAVTLLYILGVLLIAAYFALPYIGAASWSIWAAAAGTAAIAAACIVLASKRKEEKRAREQAQEETDRAREAYDEAKVRLAEAEKECGAWENTLAAAMEKIGAAPGEDADTAADRAERLLDRLTEARAGARALEGRIPEIPQDEDGISSVTGETRLSRRDAEEYLRRTGEKIKKLSSELARGEGAYGYLGDPVVLSTLDENLKREIADLNREYEAIDIAAEALRDANAKLQTLFSPIISREAARMMRRLTDGNYKSVYFDREMHFSAAREGDLSAHELEYLSDGTKDQLYLAVRLAVCLCVLPKDDPCPIILDDALACFDDARARSALELLEELARDRQIILFTCHGREKRMLEEMRAGKQNEKSLLID